MVDRDPLGIAARFESGDVEHARWCREWHRRWRRMQRPLRFAHFVERLERAERPGDVYRTLAEHVAPMVGGYTCLLFPPRGGPPLRPLPGHALDLDTARLTLPIPVVTVDSARVEEVHRGSDDRLRALRPLFFVLRASALAFAPFGDGGAIVLVERRRERIFVADDHALLKAVASRATAALLRTRTAPRSGAAYPARTEAPAPARVWFGTVLEHGIAIAERGESLSVARLRLEGLARVEAEEGPAAATRIRVIAAEVLHETCGELGILLQRGDAEYILVLPRLGPTSAALIARRLQRQLPPGVHVRAGIAAYRPGDRATDLLVRAAPGAVAAAAPTRHAV
jgi:GGDEF domain-containing protein